MSRDEVTEIEWATKYLSADLVRIAEALEEILTLLKGEEPDDEPEEEEASE